MSEIEEIRKTRLAKIDALREVGIQPYPAKFDKKNNLVDIFELKEGTKVKSAGRVMMFRDMGKLSFAHLQDESGRAQIVLQKDVLKDEYKTITKLVDLGDFIGVEGEVYKTQKGEISIMVKKWTFLGKAILSMPEKFHGVKDQEILYRQRYLDLLSNQETMDRFKLRSDFIRAIREFYWQEGFREVETPTLLHQATGAAAVPYKTHNNALDIDVVLRISHELPLKELIVGGFEKIFELGKAFRNEGADPSHLPEHTHLEHYVAYWNYEDNIAFTEKMFDHLFKTLDLPTTVEVKDKEGNMNKVDFKTPWKRIDYIKMVNEDSGLDVMSYTDVKELQKDLKSKKIHIEGMEDMSLATLVDNIYKKVSRPKIINPAIVYNYPKFLQPLARVNDEDEKIVDQFQLVVNGWEIVKAYSELVDPIDQRERFEEQLEAREAGDEEAMDIDEAYITSMEYGMPPISGWGMGIDRILTLLTGQDNLRDVVVSPLMKPENDN